MSFIMETPKNIEDLVRMQTESILGKSDFQL